MQDVVGQGGRTNPGALLTAYLVAGDAGDADGVASCLTADVVTHSPGGIRTVGRQAQVESWAAAHEGLGQLTHEIQGMVVDGTTASARTLVTGLHVGPFLGVAPTGARVRVDQALFARVVEGFIAELWEVVDTGAGLRQLGVLGEQPLSPGA